MNVSRVIVLAAVAAVLVVPATAVDAAPAAASISLKPNFGPPLKRMIISGSGFMPASQVSILFDGSPLGTAKVGMSGKFTVGFLVPAWATPGDHEVKAVAGRTRQSDSATFHVV